MNEVERLWGVALLDQVWREKDRVNEVWQKLQVIERELRRRCPDLEPRVDPGFPRPRLVA